MTSPVSKGQDAWFVAQIKPNGQKQALANLARQQFQTFAPAQRSSPVKSGMRTDALKPLFPGYVFVNFDPGTRAWTAINNTRGISRLVVNDPRRPTPLPNDFIAALIDRCDATGCLLPPENLKTGDRIRVLSGPFAGLISRIEEMKDRDRIGLLVDLMGRSVRTIVPCSAVEKLG